MDTTSLGFQKPKEEEYYDINIFNKNTQLANDLIEKNSSAIGQITLQKSENKVTVFNANGSITETIKNGDTILRIKTTTFPSSTQIVETTVENGVTTTKTTTFNSDGTIKEEFFKNLDIKSIVSAPGSVTPTISKSVDEYNIKGGRSATKITISISAEDNSTKIIVDIDGNEIEGNNGSISFETLVSSTAKQARVAVLSDDGINSKKYILNILK